MEQCDYCGAPTIFGRAKTPQWWKRGGTFFLYSALGGMVWVTVVVLVGYGFGQSWAGAQHWTGRSPLLLALLLAVALGLYLTYRWVLRYRGS
jgi:membrane protein DedA with SNARE-associated domain